MHPETGRCEISCDGASTGRALSNDLDVDVSDFVNAYVSKAPDLPKQLAAAKTDGEARDIVRRYMTEFAHADREQLFGQPTLAQGQRASADSMRLKPSRGLPSNTLSTRCSGKASPPRISGTIVSCPSQRASWLC